MPETYPNICSLGIAIDSKCDNVVVILKDRPEHHAGRYNFPGGKLDVDEHPRKCIQREFKEETGVYIPSWIPVCRKREGDITIFCYASITDDIFNIEQQDGETEVPYIMSVHDFMELNHSKMVNGPCLHFLFDQALFLLAKNLS
jgi:8-oxo-dGTP pyrophosphatase MutT (NUDIX family)